MFWLIVAFFAGLVVGTIATALLSMSEDDEEVFDAWGNEIYIDEEDGESF